MEDTPKEKTDVPPDPLTIRLGSNIVKMFLREGYLVLSENPVKFQCQKDPANAPLRDGKIVLMSPDLQQCQVQIESPIQGRVYFEWHRFQSLVSVNAGLHIENPPPPQSFNPASVIRIIMITALAVGTLTALDCARNNENPNQELIKNVVRKAD